jgi:hypothetical protein
MKNEKTIAELTEKLTRSGDAPAPPQDAPQPKPLSFTERTAPPAGVTRFFPRSDSSEALPASITNYVTI